MYKNFCYNEVQKHVYNDIQKLFLLNIYYHVYNEGIYDTMRGHNTCIHWQGFNMTRKQKHVTMK